MPLVVHESRWPQARRKVPVSGDGSRDIETLLTEVFRRGLLERLTYKEAHAQNLDLLPKMHAGL
jgi:hypothetical protein